MIYTSRVISASFRLFHNCVSRRQLFASAADVTNFVSMTKCFHHKKVMMLMITDDASSSHHHSNFIRPYSTSKNTTEMPMPSDVLFQPRLTVDEIKAGTKRLMEDVRRQYDAVAAVPCNNLQELPKIIKMLAVLDAEYGPRRSSLDLPRYVADDATIRDASVAADKELSNFDVEMSLRKDVFNVIAALESQKVLLDTFDAETQRFVKRMVINGKRSGLHLPDDKLNRVKALKQRLSELSIEFEQNISNSIKTLLFSSEELVGVSEEFLASLEKSDDGKFKIELSYPHYFPIMKKARNPATRLRLETEFNSRAKEKNIPILNEAIRIRLELAHLLGYETHAHYALELRMAKNPENVATFLTELGQKLMPFQKLDHMLFLKYKKELCESLKIPFDNKLNTYDWRYFANLAEERLFEIDHEKIREYFPVDVVIQGTLSLYERLFGLRFKPLDKNELPNWHDDVKTFAAYDAKDNKLLSYIYLDLYPRTGKYTHACCIPLQHSCEKVDKPETRQPAVTCVLANFTKPDPTNNKPALLNHDEVETFLHEFGHAVHNICSTVKYEFFSGTRVERDFVEAPSQMLEHWAWQPESLRLLSKHYKTGEPLPDDMVKALSRARHANAGVTLMRQVVLATFDQAFHVSHTEDDITKDVSALFADISVRYSNIETTPGTCMPASFGHLLGGYDAQYYGYLWSEVFSYDMFDARFVPGGILNGETGREYRRCILEPGGSVDAADMLRSFLGRDPKPDPFLKAREVTYGGEPYSTLKA